MNNFPMSGPGMAGRGPMPFPQTQQNPQISQIIWAKLHEQGPPQGWQTQLQLSNRAGTVLSMYTQSHMQANSQRLSDQQKLMLALGFERQAYTTSSSVDEYHNTINERNRTLHAMRQNQANLSMQGPNQHMPANNPMTRNVPGFNRNVPTPQMPMQVPTQMQANMQGITGGAAPQGSSMFMRPPGQSGQSSQSTNNPAQPGNLTDQSNRLQQGGPNAMDVQRLALRFRAQLDQQGTADQMRDQARRNLSTQNPEFLQQAMSRGMDPLDVYLRMRAQQQLQQAQQTQMGNPPGPSSMAANANPGQTGHPKATPGNRNQSNDVNKSTLDFAQMIGQQQDAQRSQDSGVQVVPASNNQGYQGQLGKGIKPMGLNSGSASNAGPGHSGMGSRPPAQFPPSQIPNMSQAPLNFNVSASPALNPYAAGHPGALTGQPGGLHMLPGVSPAMPTLNQPIGQQGGQTPSRPNSNLPSRSHQPSPHPGAGVHTNAMQMPQNQPAISNTNELQLPNGFNREAFQNKVNSLPPEQRENFVRQFKIRMMQQQQQQQQARGQASTQQLQPFTQMGKAPPGAVGPGHAGIQHPGMRMQNGPGMNQAAMNGSQFPGMLQQQRGVNPPFNQLAASEGSNNIKNAMPLPTDALKKNLPDFDIPYGVNNWNGLFNFLHERPTSVSTEDLQKLHRLRDHQFTMARNRANAAGVFTNNAQYISFPPDKSNEIIGSMQAGLLETNNARQVRLKDVTPQQLMEFRSKHANGDNALGRASDPQARGAMIMERAKMVAMRLGPPGQDFARQLCLRFAADNGIPLNGGNQSTQRPFTTQANPVAGQPMGLSVPNQINPMARPMPMPQVAQMASAQQAASANMPNRSQPGTVKPSQMPAMTTEQQNRAQEEMMKKRAMQFSGPTQTQKPAQGSQQPPEWAKMSIKQKEDRFMQMWREAMAETPQGPPTHIPEQMAFPMKKMVENVYLNQQSLMGIIKSYFMSCGQEKSTKDLLVGICCVKNQVKGGGAGNLQVEFTSPMLDLRERLARLIHFRKVIEQRNKRPPSTTQPTDPASQTATTTTNTASARPSSQANNKDTPPPQSKPQTTNKLPTSQSSSVQPLGRSHPDGSARYFRENPTEEEFKIKIPPNRIRKGLQPASASPDMPLDDTAQKADPSVKEASVPAAAPAKMDLPFKCSIPGCEYETTGFSSQQEQQHHERSAHKYTGDPLRWCLGSLKESLGLNKPPAARRAAAARIQSSDSSLKPTVQHPAIMKRENSTRPFTPQGRSTAATVPVEQRPASAAGSKRGASSIQGQNDNGGGSPSKRPRTAPPRVDHWQHTDWSRELMEAVWSEIPGLTTVDPLMGCRVAGFDPVDLSPPDVSQKEGGQEEKPMRREEHIEDLLNWVDPATEALFEGTGGKTQLPVQTKGQSLGKTEDWFVINANDRLNDTEVISEEAMNEYLEKGFDPDNPADVERLFGAPKGD